MHIFCHKIVSLTIETNVWAICMVTMYPLQASVLIFNRKPAEYTLMENPDGKRRCSTDSENLVRR